MRQSANLAKSAVNRQPALTPELVLLVTLEPRRRVFLRNLRDLVWSRREAPLRLVSRPAPFWTDVFVTSRLPWGRMLQSAVGHVVVIVAVLAGVRLWPQPARMVERPVFHNADVVVYQPEEYLPPINTDTNTRRTERKPPQKGDPALAAQTIISVPPEPDNRRQTIVTPPEVKLNHDVALPNVVAWTPRQSEPTIPLAATAERTADLKLPTMTAQVVAPAPEMNPAISKREMNLPQAAVVEPPPSMETASTRRLGDINMGRAQVVAPAPQLPVAQQRAYPNMTQASLSGGAVVPPPPSLGTAGGTGRRGRLIALSIQPAAPNKPVEVPAGNRRGTFAANPQGKAGAAGTPDLSGSLGKGGGQGKVNGVPTGLYVGGENPKLLANATTPRVTAAARRASTELPANAESELERQVFGNKKSYAMNLNVPNLNSAWGSWVMHFAELKENQDKADLTAPVATRAVDPGYPLELMRRNVKGTVTLSAVIRSDGSVGEVRVLSGVDDSLDEYARAALGRWRFRPATKNGNPVDLQAVVMIPFRPMKSGL